MFLHRSNLHACLSVSLNACVSNTYIVSICALMPVFLYRLSLHVCRSIPIDVRVSVHIDYRVSISVLMRVFKPSFHVPLNACFSLQIGSPCVCVSLDARVSIHMYGLHLCLNARVSVKPSLHVCLSILMRVFLCIPIFHLRLSLLMRGLF